MVEFISELAQDAMKPDSYDANNRTSAVPWLLPSEVMRVVDFFDD